MCPLLATSTTAAVHRLSDWFQTGAGSRLLEEQLPHLATSARRFHGDALLWAGCQSPLLDTVSGCMVRNHFRLVEPGCSGAAQVATENSDMSVFEGSLREVPLPNNCLDAIVVHHALEACEDPRTALRECARVLTGGGRLVVCAFNPLSLWGARAWYGRVRADSFSHLKFVNPFRLLDWLTVLGFEPEPIKYVAYNLPLDHTASDAVVWRGTRNLLAKRQLPIGGAYVLSAVKIAFAGGGRQSRIRVTGGKLAPVAYPKLSAPRILKDSE
jgi:SAM-dependent methyltransferase